MKLPQNQQEAAQQVREAMHVLNAAMQVASEFSLKIEIEKLSTHKMGDRFERPMLIINCFAEIT